MHAFEYNGSICASFVPQHNCYDFSLQNDFIFLNENPIRFGPTLQLGWGLAHLTRYGSNAFVYGYNLALGMKVQFRIFESFYIDADAKANISYAMFPLILWGGTDAGISYYFKKHVFVRGTAGILFNNEEINFMGNISCGIHY